MNTDKENLWNGKVLDELSKTELIEIGKELKIKNYSKLAKKLLIEEIQKVQLSQDKVVIVPEQDESLIQTKEEEDLNLLQRIDLIELAKELKVKNYSRLTKSALVKEIIEQRKINSSISEIVEESTKVLENKETELKKNKYGNLEDLELKELVEIGKELKIKNYSRLTKKRLIKSITEHLSSDLPEESLLENINLEEQDIKKLELSEVKKEENLNIKEEIKLEEKDSNKEEKIKDSSEEIVDSEKLKDKNSNENKLDTDSNEELKELNSKKDNSKKEPTELEKIEESHLKEEIEQGLEHHVKKEDEETKLSPEEQMRLRFLMSPSKFPFSKTNEEFLLKDEDDIVLNDLTFEEDKIVYLPIDPYRTFTYWDLSKTTLEKIKLLKLKNLYLKVSDVTGIVYNGSNEVSSWFEECLVLSKNWYINVPEGGRNYCVDLGYVLNGVFLPLVRSNTINVPRRDPSPIIKDTFVIVNYPTVETKTDTKNTESESNVFISRRLNSEESPYFKLNNFSIYENYNLKKLPIRMPTFDMKDDIQDHFIQEYEISGKREETKKLISAQPPEKLPGNPPAYVKQDSVVLEQTNLPKVESFLPVSIEHFEDNSHFTPVQEENVENKILISNEKSNIENEESNSNDYKSSYETNRSEYFVEKFDLDFKPETLTQSYYYELPSVESGKTVKVYYEWFENEIPYRKVIYWLSDPVPVIHEKIYKISWGPTWVKEFIGGSERIKYLGASERFLGSSDIHIGGSEMFIESSGRYPFSSEELITPSGYPAGSEIFIESSYRYPQGSEAFTLIGASENNLNINTSNQMTSVASGSYFRKWFE